MVSINEIRYFFCYSKRKGRIVVMKKILYILCFILTGSSAFLVSCDKPEELTPKVDNTSEDYLLPTGNILNAQDREEVQALWDEYNNAINQ